MRQICCQQPLRGFTLIELMVTIAIVAILGTLAAPSFQSFMRTAQLSSTTNSFVAVVNAARSEGMKRNLHSYITPRDGGNQWGVGWRAFVDVDFSGGFSSGDIVITEQSAVAEYIVITANGTSGETPSYIMYDGSGFSKTKAGGFGAQTLSIALADSVAPKDVRRIKIASTGRIRVCTPSTLTDANETACKASNSASNN